MHRPQLSRRTAGALVLIAGTALTACATGGQSSSSAEPSGSATASASVAPSGNASPPVSVEPSTSATAAASEAAESLVPFACTPTVTIPRTTDRAQITDVRVGSRDGYERIVFEFASGIPQTLIEGVLPPFYHDASGLPLDVAGTAFLKVTMNGASKVSPDGGITYSGSTNFEPGFDQLQQLIEGGDFEAVSTWYLGLDPGGCIRILTLDDPSRLVIDIEH